MQSSRTHQDDTSRDESSARYKYQRLRDRLRQAIQSGELSAKLPGERELARRYGANAKTINKALCDLTTEGLLIRHVGRGTFVSDGVGPAGTSRRKLLTYAWLGSGSDEKSQEPIYRSVESLLRERGHRLVSCRTSLLENGEIADTAITPGQLRSWDGLVLASRTSDRLLAELHRRHLPVVMIQNAHERIRTSVVLPDYAQGAFELAEYLVRLGHEQIGLLISRELLPAASTAEHGYRAALERSALRPVAPAVIDADFDWRKLLATDARPSALICVGAEVASSAAAQAHEAGLRLPAMLGVCAMLEAGRHGVDHALTAYEVNAESIAHWAVELLITASPGQLPRMVIVPGKLCDRGSVPAHGKPPAAAPAGPSAVVI